jgi:hypothetical protein
VGSDTSDTALPPEIQSTLFMRAESDSGYCADLSRDSTGTWEIKMIEPLYGFSVKGSTVTFDGVNHTTTVQTPFDGVCAAIDTGKNSGEVLGRQYKVTRDKGGNVTEVVYDGHTFELEKAVPSDKIVLY